MKAVIKAITLTLAITMAALVSAAPAQDVGISIDAAVDTSEALCCVPGCYWCVQIDCGKSPLACTSMNLYTSCCAVSVASNGKITNGQGQNVTIVDPGFVPPGVI